MKKILMLVMCLVLILVVTGCNNDNDNDNSKLKDLYEKKEETKPIYDGVIECLHNSKNSYIKLYLKNDKVIKAEHYLDQRTGNEKISAVEFEQGLKMIKAKKESQGFKNVEITKDGILMYITNEDTLWDNYSGSISDVYRKIHDNDAEYSSYKCITK